MYSICSGCSYMYQIVPLVSTLCMHVWAPTGTLAYYYEDSPHWWHHRDIPVMSSGMGIPFHTVISFSTSSNTVLCSGHSYMYEIVPLLLALFLYMYELQLVLKLIILGVSPLVTFWEYPSDVIRGGNSLSYSNKLWYQQQCPLFIWFIWFSPYS